MKKLLTLLAVASAFAVLSPTSAEARDHHRGHSSCESSSSRCGSCGTSVRRERVYVGRDRCGNPIYQWRTASHRCGRSSHHGHGHGHHSDRSRFNISLPGFHFGFGR